jgi:hypothetical protein
VKSGAHVARVAQRPGPTATHVVRFEKHEHQGPRPAEVAPIGRIPRMTHLLALAHRIDGMIRAGEIRDWAEAARLIGVTRARMTQIANLLLLAPDVQADIANLPQVVGGAYPVTEHDLRAVVMLMDWRKQKDKWMTIRRALTSVNGIPGWSD